MKTKILLLLVTVAIFLFLRSEETTDIYKVNIDTATTSNNKYWLLLKRKSNKELLYQGIPGDAANSTLIKQFKVKSGIPGERPTPLPEKSGKKYWMIIAKKSSADNPETAPFFLTLDIPVTEKFPYGPVPYEECNGQCNWVLPGPFGLHGVAGNENRLADSDPGSSGCIRHRDEDIGYLYSLLEPDKENIRYYIEDI